MEKYLIGKSIFERVNKKGKVFILALLATLLGVAIVLQMTGIPAGNSKPLILQYFFILDMINLIFTGWNTYQQSSTISLNKLNNNILRQTVFIILRVNADSASSLEGQLDESSPVR